MIDPAFGNWFAGFTDGEGCFLVQKKRNGYCCRFSITLRADDRSTLELIQKTLGIGRIYDVNPKNPRNPNPTCLFQLMAKGDCVKLRDVFLTFPLRAKKVVDFEIWCEALDHWLVLDWNKMADTKNRLSAVKEYHVPVA